MGKYKITPKVLIITVCYLFGIYLAIWFLFVFLELFPTGKGFSKSDWLLFLGSFLSFAGTMFLGLITVRQVNYENERIINNRHLEITPVFVIIPQGINKQVPGTSKAISLDGKHKDTFDNFNICIKNEGRYPIRNIFIFSKFLAYSISPGDEKIIIGAFPNSPDLKEYPEKIVCFDFDDCHKSISGYPNNFFLSYEDIDGAKWYQYFTLDNDDVYYEYDRIESI